MQYEEIIGGEDVVKELKKINEKATNDLLSRNPNVWSMTF